MAYGPRIGRNQVCEHSLHLGFVVVEIGIGHPGDTINSHDSHHTALPYSTADGKFGLGLAEDDHQSSSSDHRDLNDDIHRDWLRHFLGDTGYHHASLSQLLGRFRHAISQGDLLRSATDHLHLIEAGQEIDAHHRRERKHHNDT